MNDKTYDELISSIYASVLDEKSWLGLLEQLAKATGRREGSLLSYDNRAGMAPRLVSSCSQESQLDYGHYYTLDPTQRFTLTRQVGSWYHDAEEYGLSSMRFDPFYQEFMRNHGQRAISCIKLYEQGSTGAYLSLLTALDANLPTDSQQRILQRLSPHLMRAARMSSRIQQLELDVSHSQLLLEQSGTPQWLIDADGRVLYCNAAAERRMSEPDFPLCERQGRLTCTQEPALPGLLRAACGKVGAARASLLPMPALGSELLVTPVRAEGRLRLDIAQPLTLVALLSGQPRAELLVELFACTPAEVRLADLIARGLGAEECATRLGVSINTVRSQLRALFRKTDTERQGELAGLLARLGR